MWRFHRKLTCPFFTKDRYSNFDVFDHHAEKAAAIIRQRMDEGNSIDFQDLAGRLTLDSAASVLLGKELNSLSSSFPLASAKNPNLGNDSNARSPNEAFIESLAQAQKFATQRNVIGDAWPLTEFWKDKVKGHREIIDAFISPAIEEAIERKKTRDVLVEKGGEESLTFLDELVKQTDDVDLIRDETNNVLVAGKDTTAATLTFVIYMLAEYPRVLEKLRKEILGTVGTTKRPTYDDIKEMKYLRAVINETLRLYPPVPVNMRHTVADTTLPAAKQGDKPFFVPKDSIVFYHVFAMHRRKDLWGPDALEFDPERFIDERLQKYFVPNPFIFLPFNAGPRICLGQQFAYNEVSFFLIKLLQNFSSFTLDLDSRPLCTIPPPRWAGKEGRQGKEKLWPGYHLTMFIKGAMWTRMTEAADI